MSENLSVNLSEMTDNELISFKTEIEKGYEKLCSERAKELAELSNDDNFDPYSFFSGRKIDKIVKKYEIDDDGYDYLMREVLKELEQRQISIFDLEIEENSKISDEEYIKRELEKNKKFKYFK